MATTVDQYGNIIEAPVTAQEMIDQQNAEFESMGGADDDQPPIGEPIENPTPTQEELEAWASTPDYQLLPDTPTSDSNNTSTNASGSTVAGKAGSKSKKAVSRSNPLSKFSSYTYQISLYMLTPDAYNAFVMSGKKNMKGNDPGVYLVVQSGGINTNNFQRAPGFEYDYYIDNLEIKAAVALGKSESGDSGPTNQIDIKFQIIEPNSFSFISKLKQAWDTLQIKSMLPAIPYADRQTYVLGLRFLGYDAQGNVVGGSSGSFQTFYDITLKNITFKLDGKIVTYNITAAPVSTQVGAGLAHGRILSDTTAVGNDVESTVNDLIKNINEYQQNLYFAGGIEKPDQYEVEYIGVDADRIKSSSVVNMKVDSDKTKYPAMYSTTTEKVNENSAVKSTVEGGKRQMTFKGGGATSVMQAIQNIILQSDYIQKAIKNLYTNDPEPDRKTNDYITADSESKNKLKWINISTEAINLGADAGRGDYAYKIKFIIQSYAAPAANIPQAKNLPEYPGPSKRYDYWFTGKNSEIIRLDFEYNQLYATVVLDDKDVKKAKAFPTNPRLVGQRAEAPRQGRIGGQALESQNTYVNYLNDPGAYKRLNLTILGDPDWLLQDNASGSSQSKFLDSNSGQVFIEIDFKEPVDYDNNTGIMKFNNNVLFYDYPPEYNIKGISMFVSDVTSTFRGGKFVQTLSCHIAFFESSTSNTTNQSDAESARLARQGSDTNSSSGSSSTGFKQDTQPSTETIEPAAASSSPTNVPQPVASDTETNNTTANDDAANTNTTQTVINERDDGREEPFVMSYNWV